MGEVMGMHLKFTTRSSVGALALAASLGYAQAAEAATEQATGAATVEPAPALAQTASREADDDAGAIVVTASRIKRNGFNEPTPVTVIGADLIDSRAPANILDVLNEIPAFRQSSGSGQLQRSASNVSSGQSLVDLRGLGASRTLVLVNGRRFVGSNNEGTVDTGMIPVGLIERIEVVTGGASAAHGSDAVAGVTNFILKSNLTGLHGSILGGRSWHGDNNEIGASLSGGFSFAEGRGHFAFGADYNRNKGVKNIYARDWSSVEPGNTANPISFGANRPAGTPAAGFLTHVQYAAQTRGGVINSARTASGATSSLLNQTAFDSTGNPFTLIRGPVYGALMISDTNVGGSPLGNWPLKTPNERLSTMMLASYDLTDHVEAFFEGNLGRTHIKSESSFNQTPSTIILRDNPFLPATIRDTMIAANLVSIDLGRIDTDWPGLSNDNTINTVRATGGLRGTVFDKWSFETYYQLGRTKGDINVLGSKGSNILAAEYVITGPDGNPMCGPLATNPNFAASRLTATISPDHVTAGCIPFNPFGIGRNSKEAIDYVSGIQNTVVRIHQDVAAASFSGPLFTLPAGELSLALGLEWRKDTLEQTADALQLASIYTNGNFQNFSGEQTVKEGFVEVGVPLLRDLPLAKSLDLNAAARRTHYSTSGAVTTWKVGATYSPTPFLRFRVTQSRDIRAPNLQELYAQEGVSAVSNVFNPFNGQSARLASLTNGNPDLKPEKANSFTAGVVVEPLSSLRISLDYYRIKVSGIIATVTPVETLTRCFAGLQGYCAAIEFDNSVFGIRQINSRPFNQSKLLTEGADLEVAYRLPIDALGLSGRLDTRVLVNWVDHIKRTDLAGTDLLTVDYAGSVINGGMPEFSANVAVDYQNGPFATGLGARLFSSVLYDPRRREPGDPDYNPASPNSINKNRFASIPYFSWHGSYNFEVAGHRLQAFAVMNNILDSNPNPLALAAMAGGATPYDYVGRTMKVGVRFSW
jgi:iron complex outermembrane receptor protein